MASPRSFWLTLICAVCLVVFVVRIEGSPAPGSNANKKNATTAPGASAEECDLDPEPEAEAEPTGSKNSPGTNGTKSSDRQGKALDVKDKDKYNTTGGHDGAPEPEPESEPNGKNGTSASTATNASLNNQGNKPGQNGHDQKDNPTAGKSTANNTTTTTPSPTAGGSQSMSSILSFTTLALLSLPVFI